MSSHSISLCIITCRSINDDNSEGSKLFDIMKLTCNMLYDTFCVVCVVLCCVNLHRETNQVDLLIKYLQLQKDLLTHQLFYDCEHFQQLQKNSKSFLSMVSEIDFINV